MTLTHRLPQAHHDYRAPASPYVDQLLEVLLEASREALAAGEGCITLGRYGHLERSGPAHVKAGCSTVQHFSTVASALAYVAANPVHPRIPQRLHDQAVMRHLERALSTPPTEGAPS